MPQDELWNRGLADLKFGTAYLMEPFLRFAIA
jgi:hypothetical protein